MAAVANGEAPGYNYNKQSGFGVSAGGSSFGNGGGSDLSSGGGYQQEAVGQSTQEGANIDPQLLDQIRQILLREESQSGGNGGGNGGGFGGGAPSSQYGAPQPQYGPPQQQQARVVGIVLENSIPAIQVAQYKAQSQSQSAGGYSAGAAAPSSSYGAPAPSSSYGAPSPQRPSSNYGAPF